MAISGVNTSTAIMVQQLVNLRQQLDDVLRVESDRDGLAAVVGLELLADLAEVGVVALDARVRIETIVPPPPTRPLLGSVQGCIPVSALPQLFPRTSKPHRIQWPLQ